MPRHLPVQILVLDRLTDRRHHMTPLAWTTRFALPHAQLSDVLARYDDDDAWLAGPADALPPPVPRCDEAAWPTVGSVCEDCKVVVTQFNTRWGGLCFNYCGALESECTGAWAGSLDRTCDASATQRCDEPFSGLTFAGGDRGVCQCEPAGADVAANCSSDRGASTAAVCAAATGPVASSVARGGFCSDRTKITADLDKQGAHGTAGSRFRLFVLN